MDCRRSAYWYGSSSKQIQSRLVTGRLSTLRFRRDQIQVHSAEQLYLVSKIYTFNPSLSKCGLILTSAGHKSVLVMRVEPFIIRVIQLFYAKLPLILTKKKRYSRLWIPIFLAKSLF